MCICVCVYVCVTRTSLLRRMHPWSKSSWVKLRAEILHSILDWTARLRVSLPISVSCRVTRGANKLCSPIYCCFCYKNEVQVWRCKFLVLYILPDLTLLFSAAMCQPLWLPGLDNYIRENPDPSSLRTCCFPWGSEMSLGWKVVTKMGSVEALCPNSVALGMPAVCTSVQCRKVF